MPDDPFFKPDPNAGRVRTWNRWHKRFEDTDPLEVALCALADNEGRLTDAGCPSGAVRDVCAALREVLDGE